MTRSRTRTRFPTLLLASFAAAALAPRPAAADDAAKAADAMPPYNVLLLTVDALRADHLSCYGYSRPTSPRIDTFAAEEATLFRNTISHSSWTVPGVVSMLTALHPAAHGIDTRHKIMDEFFDTPLKRLLDLGYVSFGYVSTGEAFSNVGFRYKEDFVRPTLQHLLERHQDERFVMWYHLKVTHLPYAAKEVNRAKFRRPDSPEMHQHHINLVTTLSMVKAGATRWNLATKPTIEDLYDACVYEQDEYLGQVFDHLKHLGLWDNTIIVLTADHGEELLDHGLVGHASTTLQGTLYDEVLRIPLIIRVPGIEGGGVVDDIVQQADVMPTVLEALGLEPFAAAQGHSLLPAMTGKGPLPERRYAFSETSPCGWQCPGNREKTNRLKSVRSPEWKLVTRVDEIGLRENRLYDLKNDPGETVDVAAVNPEVVKEMLAALEVHEQENLRYAWQGIQGAMQGRREHLGALSIAERRRAAAGLCDELAMLRYVYRVENPSVIELRAGDWRDEVDQVWSIVGKPPAYWVCDEL